jgi:hypothetical protein
MMKPFALWILVSFLLAPLYGHTNEEGDLGAASTAIAADIAVRAHPQTLSLCAECPCLGVAQSELGLLLIAARDTRRSRIALPNRLLKYHPAAVLVNGIIATVEDGDR